VRHRALALPSAALLAAALVAGTAGPVATVAAPAAATQQATDCPPGMTPEQDVPLADFAAGVTSTCAPALRPEHWQRSWP
jgi:hypothetical protein